MQLNAIPLRANKQIKDKVYVYLMQIDVCPTNFSEFFDEVYKKRQENIVKEKLKELRIPRNKNTGNIIIFPELSVPNSLETYLKDFAIKKSVHSCRVFL